jgi:hypothetical protein
MDPNSREKLLEEMEDAERKAWDSLARYKFWMFGYHAAFWVKLNRLGEFNRPNPWKTLVIHARHQLDKSPLLFNRMEATTNAD